MPIFEYKCPNCRKLTLLDPTGACQNQLSDGRACGYTFPLNFGSGNSYVRRKWKKKHTCPPTGIYPKDYSWVNDTGSYPFYQLEAARFGSVNLDPENNYLFLYHTPSGNNCFAKVQYASGLDVGMASGVVLPLNSKLQNMHHHFSNYKDCFISVINGTGLTITEPNGSHPDEYRIKSGDSIVYSYNSATKSETHFKV